MKVLVTGGAGFIGSHVVDQLIQENHQVVITDNLSTGNEEYLNPEAKFYHVSIESDDMKAIFASESPEVVIHLAAQIDVQKSLHDPQYDAAINILGTIHLLELCKTHQTRKFIYSSSAAVYGNPNYLAIDEQHPIQPLSSYGISKYTPEKYIRMYADLTGLDYTILRYANVYGARQIPKGEGGVVSIFVDKLLVGESPVIFGDGLQTRDFIYVGDVARANIAAMYGGSREVVNISTNSPTSVSDLYSIIADIYKTDLRPQLAPAREGDILHSYLDNSKAAQVLGWKPQISLLEGLNKTVEYYQSIHKTKVLL
ncbi:NAD-dependent epimerase/dehydratase family protein [Paenibacillus sp. FJAT-26967]|uniref:NAD-dependent epimerase/dehydratase family protein n=1 Tax=Paenibacillus sp. FJAT-26967 TaxID=1729690 RepID=UPI0008394B1A|nr:NAD-dependent epimerase/dehydratase family protein [Paenibacillus sp. FJAT-26967]